MIGDADLKRRNPRQGSGGGPDLRGKLGKRGEVVSEERTGRGESVSGELHSVAGVTGEPDDEIVKMLGLWADFDVGQRSSKEQTWLMSATYRATIALSNQVRRTHSPTVPPGLRCPPSHRDDPSHRRRPLEHTR